MDDPQAVRELLVKHGLADKADALMALVRPSVRIFTQPADDSTIPVGVSKIGGNPDLPPDFEWPMWEHEPSDSYKAILAQYNQPLPDKIRPLGFLAQFNLAEVAPYDVEHLLPASGMLYFFYDGVEQPWWVSKGDGGAMVSYYGDTTVKRTAAPHGQSGESQFKSCSVRFKTELTLPDMYSSYVEYPYTGRVQYPKAIQLTKEEVERYESILDAMVEDSKTKWKTAQRLLGHAQPVQFTAEPEGHLLLLQLDSDDDARMMWGDVGKLYFWLPEEALAARRFDEMTMELQCH
jgi:uncharacterized protein YwqG